jgi:hypothetical protein
MKRESLVLSLIGIGVIAVGLIAVGASGSTRAQSNPEPQISKGKIYQETYPLLTETDLYCSYGVLDGTLPELKVIGAERQEERIQLGDGDIIYINGGGKQGIAPDQVYVLFEVGQDVKSPRTGINYGPLIQKVGRGRVISVEDSQAVLRIEKSCSPVAVGNSVVQFVEKNTVIGKDGRFVPYSQQGPEAVKGEIIYLGADLNQIGSGNWAVIDLGQEDGLQVGNQLTVSILPGKNLPRRTLGSAVAIDVQARTATIKILSAGDAIRLGYQVEIK